MATSRAGVTCILEEDAGILPPLILRLRQVQHEEKPNAVYS